MGSCVHFNIFKLISCSSRHILREQFSDYVVDFSKSLVKMTEMLFRRTIQSNFVLVHNLTLSKLEHVVQFTCERD